MSNIASGIAMNIGGQLAGAGLSSLFGSRGGSTFSNALLGSRVDTPGFRLSSQFSPITGANVSLARTSPLEGMRQERFGRILTDLDTLRGDVRPGFGRLTSAVVEAINSQFARRESDLRSQFERRRVAGASFADREINSLVAERAQAEKLARSEAFLQEIGLTREILGQENAQLMQEVNRELAELQVAAGTAQNMTAALSANEQIRAKLLAESAQLEGGFFGDLGKGIGTSLGEILKSSGTSSASPGTIGTNFQQLINIRQRSGGFI